MIQSRLRTILTLLLIFSTTQSLLAQESDRLIVQAILFYSPTCPHCHEVLETHLPPIKEKYGDQLQLVGINTSNPIGTELYSNAVNMLQIPSERRGVPTLIIGDVVLVGGAEIPEQLPGLIDQGLAQGGIGWPNIPGLRDAIPNLPPASGSQGTSGNTEEVASDQEIPMTKSLPDASNSIAEDPLGSALGWLVLAFMILSLTYAILRIWANPEVLLQATAGKQLSTWQIPIVAIAGLAIAAYLAYVEISRAEAICGPIGQCNIVQSSQYAQIMGIPIAVLGLIFYLAILGFWLLRRLTKTGWMKWISMLMLVSVFLGMVFSVYLTTLELLVIRAICAWCLSSAIVTTTLLLVIVSRLIDNERKLKLKGKAKFTFPFNH